MYDVRSMSMQTNGSQTRVGLYMISFIELSDDIDIWLTRINLVAAVSWMELVFKCAIKSITKQVMYKAETICESVLL